MLDYFAHLAEDSLRVGASHNHGRGGRARNFIGVIVLRVGNF